MKSAFIAEDRKEIDINYPFYGIVFYYEYDNERYPIYQNDVQIPYLYITSIVTSVIHPMNRLVKVGGHDGLPICVSHNFLSKILANQSYLVRIIMESTNEEQPCGFKRNGKWCRFVIDDTFSPLPLRLPKYIEERRRERHIPLDDLLLLSEEEFEEKGELFDKFFEVMSITSNLFSVLRFDEMNMVGILFNLERVRDKIEEYNRRAYTRKWRYYHEYSPAAQKRKRLNEYYAFILKRYQEKYGSSPVIRFRNIQTERSGVSKLEVVREIKRKMRDYLLRDSYDNLYNLWVGLLPQYVDETIPIQWVECARELLAISRESQLLDASCTEASNTFDEAQLCELYGPVLENTEDNKLRRVFIITVRSQ